MIKFIQIYLCVVIMALIIGGNCKKVSSDSKEKPVVVQTSPTIHENPKKDIELELVQARLTNENVSNWKISKLDTGLGEKTKFYFFDKETGWAGNKNLFKTEDGGATWKSLNVEKPPNAVISQVFFTDENHGWIVIQTREKDFAKYKNNYFWFFQTNDGGESWSKLSEESAVVITDLSFADENVGWLVGRKYTGVGPLISEVFIQITNDGGKTWKDVSESLKKSFIENQETLNQIISDIAFSKKRFILISSSNQIFQTDDFGNNWTYISYLPDYDPYTSLGVKRIGVLADDSLWLTGSSHHSMAIATVAQKFDTYWKQYALENFFFTDAFYLTNNEIIAGGLRRRRGEKFRGVIVYSADSGRSWSILSENSKSENISKLQIINQSTIIAWDNNGAIYSLTRP